jgi:hypothetical protein
MQLNTDSPWPRLTKAVPCSQPHIAEVFYANPGYWPKGKPYPGDATVGQNATAACNSAFQSYDGIPNSQSIYTWDNILPNASAWANGDRALQCVAYHSTTAHPAGETLTGSIKGSRR